MNEIVIKQMNMKLLFEIENEYGYECKYRNYYEKYIYSNKFIQNI